MNELPDTRTEFVPFQSGLDLVTPALRVAIGSLSGSQGYEIYINGGYRGIDGHERFDGRDAPSEATYTKLPATMTGSYSLGDTLAGATSGATGVIIAAVDDEYFILTKVVGTFGSSENLNVGGPTIAASTGAPSLNGAPTVALSSAYTNLAADEYRADIQKPTGSGGILGVWMLAGVKFCFRNNAGGTAAIMYKATTSGWVAVPFGEEVSFSNANTSVQDADTLTQGGVTATIKRVVVETGTLGAGVNTGRLIIHTRAGGNFAAGAATSTGAGALTLSGAQTAIALAVGGRYEFVNHNFGDGMKMYGVSGTNYGFEHDGTDYGYVPIHTGMTADAPDHVTVHKEHLFYLYGRSVQHSGITTPYEWTILTGASEIAISDEGTGFAVQPGTNTSAALLITAANSLFLLYGTGAGDWELVRYREEIGADAYSLVDVGYTAFLDGYRITSLQASQDFGNFQSASLSALVQPYLEARRGSLVASYIVRKKNQARWLFDDGSALYGTFANRKMLGFMPQALGFAPTCSCSLENSAGEEEIYVGTSGGWVYQMDKGTSFDGEDVYRYLKLHFHHSKSPRVVKKYYDCSLEAAGDGYAEFDFAYELGYGSADKAQPDASAGELSFSAVQWDSFTWDQFVWDSRTLAPSRQKMYGSGENVSLIIRSQSDSFAPLLFSGALLRLSPRKQMR